MAKAKPQSPGNKGRKPTRAAEKKQTQGGATKKSGSTRTKRPTGSSGGPWLRSQSRLADAVNVSRRALQKWLAHPEWDLGSRPNRKWTAKRVLDWRDRYIRARPGSTIEDIVAGDGIEPKTVIEADLQLKREKIKVERIKVARLKRELVPVELVRERNRRQVETWKSTLLNMPEQIQRAPELSAVDPDVRRLVGAAMRRIAREIMLATARGSSSESDE